MNWIKIEDGSPDITEASPGDQEPTASIDVIVTDGIGIYFGFAERLPGSNTISWHIHDYDEEGEVSHWMSFPPLPEK
jgi:hypothetical protein